MDKVPFKFDNNYYENIIMHQTSKNSHMKICTWNSQGNPLNDAIKLNILNHLLTIEQCTTMLW